MLKQAIGAVALTLATCAALAAPDGWPQDKPVTLVVPFPPGGSTDLIAREISSRLGARLGTSVVVDNRSGATGTIGAAQVARSAPDGHTLLVSSLGPFAVAPHLMKVQYDALKDLAPVTVLVQAPNVLVVPAASPHQSLPQVLEYLKAHPATMTFASSGSGSSDHLSAELFWQQTGTTGVHVPYRGGGPVVADLLGNQVQASFMNINTAMPHIRAGKMRALAITSAQRSPLLPQVPTLQESGVKGANIYSWQAVAGPAGLPPAVASRIQQEVRHILQDPPVQAKLLELGFEMVLNTPTEFAAYQEAEFKRWQALVRDRGITAN